MVLLYWSLTGLKMR